MGEEAKGKGTLASSVLQQFLRASLETMEDDAWTKGLSCELSRWLGSSASSSAEKVGFPPGSTQRCSCRCPTGAGAAAGALPTRPAHAASPAHVPQRAFPCKLPGDRLKLGLRLLSATPREHGCSLPTWSSANRSGCCYISDSDFLFRPFPSLPMQPFLYKALGTVLGACKAVLHIHVQEKLLQHLTEANAEEPSEAQVSSPLLQLL